MLVNESQLDNWVRGNARDAQGLIVELVARLVAASVPRPRERRFPLGDSISQHGPDGILDTELGFEPFVPEGRSYWEIGTSHRAGAKATADYNDLVEAIPAPVRTDSTFVFVTPLSGTKSFEYTWKDDAQERWLAERLAIGEWKDVRVIDGTRLIDWVGKFRPIELWLAQRTTRLDASQIEIPEHRWDITKSIGAPPPLVTRLFSRSWLRSSAVPPIS
jgi:hypothetical protein